MFQFCLPKVNCFKDILNRPINIQWELSRLDKRVDNLQVKKLEVHKCNQTTLDLSRGFLKRHTKILTL